MSPHVDFVSREALTVGWVILYVQLVIVKSRLMLWSRGDWLWITDVLVNYWTNWADSSYSNG